MNKILTSVPVNRCLTSISSYHLRASWLDLTRICSSRFCLNTFWFDSMLIKIWLASGWRKLKKIWLEYRQQDTWYFLTWCPVTRYLTSRILTRNYWLDFSYFMFCLLLWWFFHFFSVSILFICCVWECQSTTEAGRESWRYLYPGAGADREVEREREREEPSGRVLSPAIFVISHHSHGASHVSLGEEQK